MVIILFLKTNWSLLLQSRCPYATSKGRNRKRVGGEITISPLWHLGHKCGSMPVVEVINSRVFLYSITSGGHTFKYLRINFKLRALNRGARNPLCLILTNCFGSICSVNSFRILTPHMVSHFSWFSLPVSVSEACSVVVNKFRSKRTVGQADMTLALLGHNLYKYLGIIWFGQIPFRLLFIWIRFVTPFIAQKPLKAR